jgi:hypothetical protein
MKELFFPLSKNFFFDSREEERDEENQEIDGNLR